MTAQELIEFKANQKTPEEREIFMEVYNKSGLSAYDFCFIFPNNMLKRHGVPLRRGGKKIRKIARRRLIGSLFNPITDVVSREVIKAWDNSIFYQYPNINTIDCVSPTSTNDFLTWEKLHDEK